MDEVMGRFGRDRAKSRTRYKDFIAEGMDEGTERLYARGNWPAIWGSEGFCQTMRERFGKERHHEEIPQSKRERPRPTLSQIEEAVCAGYRIDRDQLTRKRRGQWNEPRNVAIYVARERWGYALKEIGSAWGGLKYSSISSMVYAVKRLLKTNRGVAEDVERIERAMIKRQS